MLSLVDEMAKPEVDGTPVLILSNRPDAKGLARAAERGIQTQAIDHKAYPTRRAHEEAVHEALLAAKPDLICLAGYMRVLSAEFVANWQGRMINIHPSLLPAFRGLHTHARALDAGVALHGCTVHEVTAELDDGPILGQAIVSVRPGDTPDTLSARVLTQEHILYTKALARWIKGETTPFLINALDD